MGRSQKNVMQREWHDFLTGQMGQLGFKLFHEENLKKTKYLGSDPGHIWQTYWYTPTSAMMFLVRVIYDKNGLDWTKVVCIAQMSKRFVSPGDFDVTIPRSPTGSESGGLSLEINDTWSGGTLHRAVKFIKQCLKVLGSEVDAHFVDAGLHQESWTPWHTEKFFRPKFDAKSHQMANEYEAMIMSKFPTDFPYKA